MARWRRLGPGFLVTAAFVGPGTVTTASKAGASFGCGLIWALLFSVVATLVMQEMAARLGIVARRGLGEAVRDTYRHPLARTFVCGLVVVAIGFGNAAYQTGNITGAAVGLEVLSGWPVWLWSLIVGAISLALLSTGTYRIIEWALIGLVLLMSGVFLATAVMVRPDLTTMARGTLPQLPAGSLLTVLGLIGTTVVPYNLFLHASTVQQKWPASVPVDAALRKARADLTVSILLGGAITLAIMITAAAAFFPGGTIQHAGDMARQLEPTLGGRVARLFFACGLLAAGLTSAITAPLAAAFATAGALGWNIELKSRKFRFVWLTVLLCGTVLSTTLGKSPTQTILVAQVANGLLLPVIAILLIITVNRSDLMGQQKNGLIANALGALVVLMCLGLGLYKVIQQLV